MKEPLEEVIHGRTFQVMPLTPTRLLALWPLVAKGFHGDIDMVDLTEGEIKRLQDAFFATMRVDGKEMLKVMDAELHGEFPTVMKALQFAVRVNYRDPRSAAAQEEQAASGAPSSDSST